MVNRRVTAQTLLCAHWFVCLLLQQFNRLIHFIFTEKHCIQSAAVVPLQSRNSKFTECCVHLIYIKRFLRIDVCAMQECSMHVCECIHFRLDLLEGFFCQSSFYYVAHMLEWLIQFFIIAIFITQTKFSCRLLPILHFFPSIHSVYISFKLRPIMPNRNCYWVLSFGFILKIYNLNSFKRQIFHLAAIFFFILSCFRSKNQNTWFKSNCMIIFYYVFNRKSVKIQWTLDINHLPQLSIMGILLRYKFGYRQYDIRRPISI